MNSPDYQQIDGTERARFFWDGSRLTRAWDSLDESRIMAENRALSGTAKTLEWGRPALRMSWAQYHFFLRLYPELDPRNRADSKTRRDRWRRICNDVDFRDLAVGKF